MVSFIIHLYRRRLDQENDAVFSDLSQSQDSDSLRKIIDTVVRENRRLKRERDTAQERSELLRRHVRQIRLKPPTAAELGAPGGERGRQGQAHMSRERPHTRTDREAKASQGFFSSAVEGSDEALAVKQEAARSQDGSQAGADANPNEPRKRRLLR